MPTSNNPQPDAQAYRPPEDAHTSDTQRLLNTLDRVFSTFREQLQTEAPRPFTGNAKTAADTFNDIVAGLRFDSVRPGLFTIEIARVTPTQIEIKWTDVAGNADGYRIERCQGQKCEDLNEIGRVGSTERSFRDAGLSRGTFYRYRVVAFDSRGETASNTVGTTTGTSTGTAT
jgi:hypothetical protein